MAKKIAWTDQAKADVRGIDRETAIDLLHRLARFLTTEEGDVKRLTVVRCGHHRDLARLESEALGSARGNDRRGDERFRRRPQIDRNVDVAALD